MARNPERDAILTVSIPRNSETFRRLQQDAEETNVSLPKLVALRVSDWYKLAHASTQMSSSSVTEPVQLHHGIATDEQQAQLNASAALDEWL